MRCPYKPHVVVSRAPTAPWGARRGPLSCYCSTECLKGNHKGWTFAGPASDQENPATFQWLAACHSNGLIPTRKEKNNKCGWAETGQQFPSSQFSPPASPHLTTAAPAPAPRPAPGPPPPPPPALLLHPQVGGLYEARAAPQLPQRHLIHHAASNRSVQGASAQAFVGGWGNFYCLSPWKTCKDNCRIVLSKWKVR